MRSLLPAVAVGLVAMAVAACGEEHKDVLSGNIDPETFPTMMTRDVETLISDSGITRYRINTPLWLVFDEAAKPYWKFPNTLRLVKFDNLLRTEATVECDSAKYLKLEQLWRLDGNVRIANVAKEKFLTNQLFWDQRNRKIYSDSFIHIEKVDRTIEGYGFVSDEQLTNYTVNNVSGIFPANGFGPGGSDTQSTDTTARSAPAEATDSAAVMPRSAVKPSAPRSEIIKSDRTVDMTRKPNPAPARPQKQGGTTLQRHQNVIQ